jgi:hypothetical protein
MRFGNGAARTTPRIRAELQAAKESTRPLAARYGLNAKTVAKWRNRATMADGPMGPSKPKSTVPTEIEDAIVVEFRRRTYGSHGISPALLYSALGGSSATRSFYAVRWPALLFGIRRMGRYNLTRVLIVRCTIGTRAKANSLHPSSREGHRAAGGEAQRPVSRRPVWLPSSSEIRSCRSTVPVR